MIKNICVLEFVSRFPCFFMVTGYFCLYVIYLGSYLIPTILNETDSPDLTFFPKTNENNKNYNAFSLVYFVVYHLFLLLFLFSWIKTTTTFAGNVSIESSNEIAFEIIKNYKISQESIHHNFSLFQRHLKVPNLFVECEESPTFEENNNKTNFVRLSLFNLGKMIENQKCFDASKNILDFLLEMDIKEEDFFKFAKENFKYCEYCRLFRSPRAYHCKECNQCILKMDHHCEWLHCCIGLQNYKYFMNFIFHGSFLFLLMIITFLRRAWESAFDFEISMLYTYFIIFIFLTIVIVFLRFFGLVVFHFTLILTGRTSREFIANKKGSQIRRYDLGYSENLKNVLGENKFYWFLPF